MKKLILILGILTGGLSSSLACDQDVDEFIMWWKFGDADGGNRRFVEDACQGQTLYLYNESTMNNYGNTPGVSVGNYVQEGNYNLLYLNTLGNWVTLTTIPAAQWPADQTAWVYTLPTNLPIQPNFTNFKVQHSGAGVCAHNNQASNKARTLKLNLHTVSVDAGLNQTSCSGEEVVLNGSTSGSTFNWTPGNYNTLSPTVSPNSTTTYTLTSSQTFAGETPQNMNWNQVYVTCQASDNVTVNVSQKPSVHPEDFALCSNDPFPTLDAGSVPVAYEWKFSSLTAPTITVGYGQYLNTNAHGYGSYKLTVWGANGCSNTCIYNVYPDPSTQLNSDFSFSTYSPVGQNYSTISMTSNEINADVHYWNIAISNSSGQYISSVEAYFGANSTYNSGNLPEDQYYLLTHGVQAQPCNEWTFTSKLTYPSSGMPPRRRGHEAGETIELPEDKINELIAGIESGTLGESKEVVFSVYPNPASNDFTLEIENLDFSQNAEIQIISIDGKLVYKETINNARMNIHVADLQNGIYFVLVQNGNKSSKTKLIKQ